MDSNHCSEGNGPVSEDSGSGGVKEGVGRGDTPSKVGGVVDSMERGRHSPSSKEEQPSNTADKQSKLVLY